jgi:FdhD protein
VPVAIECNGLGYAVLMASPDDLLDLGFGFALTERLIDGVDDVLDAEMHAVERGMLLRLTLAPRVADRVSDRVRHRTADSSCGLCGVESLEQALRPLPLRHARWAGEDAAVFAALNALEAAQPLGAATHAVHAAAACAADGTIRRVREDVGRHNAFDKLIGAMLRDGMAWDDGFALLTSRCSYELVEKAALSDCPMLATISAPTALAIDRAREAGLALRVLARPDALLRPVL